LLLISLFLWAERVLSLHLSCTSLCFGNLSHTRDLNTNPAAHGYYTYHFTCPFLCLLILFIVFHTFLNLKTSKTHSIFLRIVPSTHSQSFVMVHLLLCSIVVGSFLDLFIFTLSCSFCNHSFKMSASINLVHCITKFEANCIRVCHVI
jgi:hypothetical protein